MNEQTIIDLYEALQNAIDNVNHFYEVQDPKLEMMWRDIAERYIEELRNLGEE